MYVRALVREFRLTLCALAVLVAIGTGVHRLTPQQSLGGRMPPFPTAVYGGWMALLAQPLYSPPQPWYLMLLYAAYPVLGFILIGEGVVRLALLMMSRRHGEKEWMRVVASTYRDHVILCGLGHLGYRVLEQLVASQTPTVVLERSKTNVFLAQAKAMGVPVLVRDMKEDQALIDAGVEHAATVILCSNDEMANLEVAIDSRRMNPKVRVVMRFFDQQLAGKIAGALTIDSAFSSSALAAPVVAAMAFRTRVLSTVMIAGQPHVAAEVTVENGSPLAGKKISEVEVGYAARVLARTPAGGAVQSPPSAAVAVAIGDVLVVHTAANQLPTLAAAGQRGRA
ncbi:MAG: TrkA-N domain protein [Phycisphaerales bacterium]|nr:TrkA-N domain protein [Phycisphaerales bacterium]